MIHKTLAICMLCVALLGCGGREAAKPTQTPERAPIVLAAKATEAAETPAPSPTPASLAPTQAQPVTAPDHTVDAIVADGAAVREENAAIVGSELGKAPLNVSAGGSIQLLGGTVAAADAGVPCLSTAGDAAVSLTGVTMTGTFARLAEIDGGNCALTAARQTLAGDVLLRNGAAFRLNLTEASVFTGAFAAEGEAVAHISMSADSVWSVTAETTVGILVNADAKMTNIRSNGFTVYYNAELAENAYLKGGGFLLDGGGFLTPLI